MLHNKLNPFPESEVDVKARIRSLQDLFKKSESSIMGSFIHGLSNDDKAILHKLVSWEQGTLPGLPLADILSHYHHIIGELSLLKSHLTADTVLTCAAEHGFSDLVNDLLQKGSEINEVNNQSRTPIFVAASNGHLETVRCLLLAKNVKVLQIDRIGHSPLTIATYHNHTAVVQLLVSSDAVQRSKNRKTCLDLVRRIALKLGNHEIVTFIDNPGPVIQTGALVGDSPLMHGASAQPYLISNLHKRELPHGYETQNDTGKKLQVDLSGF